MPAVFQIVSRDSGEAVALSQDLPVSADTTVDIVHTTQNDQDPGQMWVLTPRDPEDLLNPAIQLARPRNRNRPERHGNRTFGGRAYSYASFRRTGLADQSSPCESPLLLLARGQQRSSNGPLGRRGDPDLHPHGAPEPTVDISACLCSVRERRIGVVDPRPRAPATGSRAKPSAPRPATRGPADRAARHPCEPTKPDAP